MFRRMLYWLLFVYAGVAGAEAFLKEVTLLHHPQQLEVQFHLTSEVKYHLFSLQDPERMVLDLEDTRQHKGTVAAISIEGTPFQKVRSGVHKGQALRIVFDMRDGIIPTARFLSKKTGEGVILQLSWKALPEGWSAPVPAARAPVAPTVKRVKKSATTALKYRPFIIALDPGHGGSDPGAIGVAGSKEKKIVLEIARRIKKRIDAEPHMRAVLIRDGDYFIPLRRRMEIARKHQADLFVSIHADAFHQPHAYGASVFVVSKRGASSEAAKWIADIENKADLLGGSGIDHKDTVLASVLLDLSQTASNAASMEVAKEVLKEIAGVTTLHKNKVEQAGFMVLKSPDIPSILVETGFISNRKGEAHLNNATHQEELAFAVSRAIRRYFQKKPRPFVQQALP